MLVTVCTSLSVFCVFLSADFIALNNITEITKRCKTSKYWPRAWIKGYKNLWFSLHTFFYPLFNQVNVIEIKNVSHLICCLDSFLLLLCRGPLVVVVPETTEGEKVHHVYKNLSLPTSILPSKRFHVNLLFGIGIS